MLARVPTRNKTPRPPVRSRAIHRTFPNPENPTNPVNPASDNYLLYHKLSVCDLSFWQLTADRWWLFFWQLTADRWWLSYWKLTTENWQLLNMYFTIKVIFFQYNYYLFSHKLSPLDSKERFYPLLDVRFQWLPINYHLSSHKLSPFIP